MASKAQPADGPPISVQAAINLAWALMLRCSEDAEARAVGDEYQKWVSSLRDKAKDETSQRFLEEMWLILGATLQNLDVHQGGYRSFRAFRQKLLEKNVEYLEDLTAASVSSVRSLLPRVFSVGLGGASSFTVVDSGMGGGVTTAVGIAVVVGVLFGVAVEIGLRVYRNYQAPKEMEKARDETEQHRTQRFWVLCGQELAAFGTQLDDLVGRLYGRKHQVSSEAIGETVLQVLPGLTAAAIEEMMAQAEP